MKKNYSTITNDIQFLLLGDSHAGAIGRAAKEAGIPFVGGPMGAGREFTAPFVDWNNKDPVFRSGYANELYRSFLGELEANSLQDVKIPLLCTFGFALHFYATTENWEIYREVDGKLASAFLEGPLFHDLICAMAQGALDFYRTVLKMRVEVIAVLPPQKVPETSEPSVFQAAQNVLLAKAERLGLPVLDVRDGTTGFDKLQHEDFSQENDPIHGNTAFGQAILNAFVSQRISADVGA
ncbi:hypothetical protein ACQU0X_10570 [Pseudovibrio ascidiaceicola]|uniref:hypothetical protein n=1 Tax=Pseudovibrio ascidiaceicola TaxID=285279 RepID=UPI003D362011